MMTRPMVDHVMQREERLQTLVERLGIDIGRLVRADHGTTLAKANWNCIRCPHPNACLDWLNARAAGLSVNRPHFCPNCELLSAYLPANDR